MHSNLIKRIEKNKLMRKRGHMYSNTTALLKRKEKNVHEVTDVVGFSLKKYEFSRKACEYFSSNYLENCIRASQMTCPENVSRKFVGPKIFYGLLPKFSTYICI